jgi:hypothetical protein
MNTHIKNKVGHLVEGFKVRSEIRKAKREFEEIIKEI